MEEDASGRLRRGWSHYWQGEYAESIRAFEEALQRGCLSPDRVYRALGFAYGHLGHMDRAVVALRTARQLNPESFESCYWLGLHLCQRPAMDEGISLIRAALQIDPTNLHAQVDLAAALVRKAGRATAAQRLDPELIGEAHQIVRQVLRISPNFAPALCRQGEIEWRLGDLRAAAASLEAAIRADPDYLKSYLILEPLYLIVWRPWASFRTSCALIDAQERVNKKKTGGPDPH